MSRKTVVLIVGPHTLPTGGSPNGMYIVCRDLVNSPISELVAWRFVDATVPVPLPSMFWRLLLAARRAWDVLRELLFRRVDVVFVLAPYNHVRLLDKLAMCLMGKLAGKRVVLSFQSEVRRFSRCRPFTEGIVQAAVACCDVVICQTQRAADTLAEVVNRRRGIVVAPNWVDLDLFANIAASRGSGWRRDVPTVFFIGRIETPKGVFVLADAAARLLSAGQELRLVYAGSGGADAALAEHCRQLGIAEHVEFLGSIAGDAKLAALDAADVMVLPSDTEGMPVAILEAMACGMPVVATPVGGIPTLIEHGKGGLLVPPRDAPALAAALMQILNNPQFAHEMGRSNRAVACTRHDIAKVWPIVADALIGQAIR